VCVLAGRDGIRIVLPGRVTGEKVERRPCETSRALLSAVSSGNFSVTEFMRIPVGTGERFVEVDQSNESVILGEDAVVKWHLVMDVEPGPLVDRISLLAAAGFTAMPAPLRVATWRGYPVATVMRYIRDAQDGWDWAVQDVRAWALSSRTDLPVEEFGRIGEITARMHRAFEAAGPLTVDAARWRPSALATLDEACHLMDGKEGDQLGRLRERIAQSLTTVSGSTIAIPIHGDFHVGQVLRSPEGQLYVTDFDGNPVLSAQERAEPQSPARDVAGMLASIDHVARVVIARTEGVDAARVRSWIVPAQEAFLALYRSGAADLLDERLLLAFRLEQECREFVYAARHLPHWRYVPHAALADLFPED